MKIFKKLEIFEKYENISYLICSSQAQWGQRTSRNLEQSEALSLVESSNDTEL